jgi:hypothetical protein
MIKIDFIKNGDFTTYAISRAAPKTAITEPIQLKNLLIETHAGPWQNVF